MMNEFIQLNIIEKLLISVYCTINQFLILNYYVNLQLKKTCFLNIQIFQR